jgi:hypothetical protein
MLNEPTHPRCAEIGAGHILQNDALKKHWIRYPPTAL